MENYEINDVVENVVEVGEEIVAETVEGNGSNGMAKAGYVGAGALIGVGVTLLVKWAKKKLNDRKAKKKAEATDITKIEIPEIPDEEEHDK